VRLQRSGAGVSAVCAAPDAGRLAAPVRRGRARGREADRTRGLPRIPTAGAVHAGLTLGTEPALRGKAAAAGLTLLFITAYALPVTD
jgi:hypothetical protein